MGIYTATVTRAEVSMKYNIFSVAMRIEVRWPKRRTSLDEKFYSVFSKWCLYSLSSCDES